MPYKYIFILINFFCINAWAGMISDYTPNDQLAIILQLNQEGRYADSLSLIQEIPKPSTAILLEKARAQKQLGKNKQAITLYRQILTQEPTWSAARLELAELLEQNGHYSSAINHYYQILDDDELPPALRQNLQNSTNQLAQSQKDWYLRFNLSGYYDGNINKAPNQGRIEIQGYRFDFDEPIAAYVFAPEIRMGYRYQFSERFAWQSHAAALANWALWSNGDIGHDYDKLYLQLQSGPAFQWNPNQWGSLQFYGRQAYQGYQFDYRFLGAQADYNQQFGQWIINFNNDFSVREYDFDELSGWQNRSQVNLIWGRNAAERYRFGLEYIYNDAQLDIHRFQSGQASLIWYKKYPYNINMTTSGYYNFRAYQGYSQLFQSKRQDHELGMSIDLSKSDWNIWQITPHFQYSYQAVYSNQEVFSQDSHQMAVYFVKDF
ncbi:MAG: surface lipoprotein assembly modifier [Alphaproteobacteria bacterium]